MTFLIIIFLLVFVSAAHSFCIGLIGNSRLLPLSHSLSPKQSYVGGTKLFQAKRFMQVSGKKPNRKKRTAALSKRLLGYWRVVRQFLLRPWRKWFARDLVYVLELEGGKYYVGTTSRGMKRIQEHMSDRGGSAYTRLHRPIRVIARYRCPPQYAKARELQVTCQMLLDKGLQNVRGACFSEVRDFDHSDAKMLTSVLGHFLDRDYEELRIELTGELEMNPIREQRKGARLKRKTYDKSRRNKAKDKCFKCGEFGHWAADCPN